MYAIELKTQVIDLTKKESNLRPVSDKKIKEAHFLEEVYICSSYPCVYFKDKNINPDGTYLFELGVLKLPANFQHVAYRWENGKLIMPNKSTLTVRDYDIYTTLLMKMEAKSTEFEQQIHKRKYFHLCENDDDEIMPRSIGHYNCAELVTPQNNDIKFVLYYFEGALSFYNGARTGNFYLISLCTSERVVFYYAIETPEYGKNTEEISEWLRLLEENPERANKIRVDEPDYFNDKLGIYVCPQARIAI
jgi:hypothetical protein